MMPRLTLALAVTAIAAQGANAPCVATQSSTLRGRVYAVTADVPEMPLSGHVLRATNGRYLLETVANRDGYYEFLNVPAGEWWISGDQPGLYRMATKIDVLVNVAPAPQCYERDIHVKSQTRTEQIAEAWDDTRGYAIAAFQLLAERFFGSR